MHHSILKAALVACIASTALAAPKKGHHIKIDQVKTGKVFKNGPLSMVKTYKKYGVKPASSLVEAAAAVQSGIVTATPEQYDSEYLCPVTVGSDTLMLDFDTGSSDLWVFSTLMPSSESSGHTVYNPSTGTKESGETWDISYEDGSGAKGVVYADKAVVGGVTATSQAVEAATSVSSTFVEDTQSDGLLGLGFQSINTCSPNTCETFFNTVEPTLASPVFTADLKKGAAGSYTFGFIDTALYTGSITYVAVNNGEGYWGFTAGGYSIGTSTTTSGSIGSAIADTGTTLFYLPAAVAKAYWAKVSGSSNSATYGGYVFPCSGASSLPNFNVNIGGTVFTVPGSYMNYAPANSAGTTCFGGIQSDAGVGFAIFGDIFLKSVYVVFEPETPKIGFAAQ